MESDWNGLTDLIANLITKYAGVLDLDSLPEITPINMNTNNETNVTMVENTD